MSNFLKCAVPPLLCSPEDFPDWNFAAFPDLDFTPVEPLEVLQGGLHAL